MLGFFEFITRVYRAFSPPSLAKDDSPLRIGILGAARVTPISLILPARDHPGVIIAAVAARDRTRAEAYAKKHGIPRVFDSYDGMSASRFCF